ncbi:MAG: hypothetical protein AABY22_17160, partial [Nanoarchaeota archaeon]
MKFYLDPNGKTYSDAKNSAIKAGFSVKYAETIISIGLKWVSDSIRQLNRAKMLQKAERNLDKFLDEKKDKKIKADITKFVAERIGKEIYGKTDESPRTQLNIAILL